jgi:hypothetical protein
MIWNLLLLCLPTHYTCAASPGAPGPAWYSFWAQQGPTCENMIRNLLAGWHRYGWQPTLC